MCNLPEYYKIKRIYHLKSIQANLEQVELRIKELQSLETVIRQQMQIIESTAFRKEVHISRLWVNRYCNRTDKWNICIEYRVNLRVISHIPSLEGCSYLISDQKTFLGREIKAACEYARELAEAQEAAIVVE